MTAMVRRQVQHFRKYARPEPSNWRLVPVILLAAFDVGIIGWIVWQLWRYAT